MEVFVVTSKRGSVMAKPILFASKDKAWTHVKNSVVDDILDSFSCTLKKEGIINGKKVDNDKVIKWGKDNGFIEEDPYKNSISFTYGSEWPEYMVTKCVLPSGAKNTVATDIVRVWDLICLFKFKSDAVIKCKFPSGRKEYLANSYIEDSVVYFDTIKNKECSKTVEHLLDEFDDERKCEDWDGFKEDELFNGENTFYDCLVLVCKRDEYGNIDPDSLFKIDSIREEKNEIVLVLKP